LEVFHADLGNLKVLKNYTIPFTGLTDVAITDSNVIVVSSNEYLVLSDGKQIGKGKSGPEAKTITSDNKVAIFDRKAMSLQIVESGKITDIDISTHKNQKDLYIVGHKGQFYMAIKSSTTLKLYELTDKTFTLKAEIGLEDNNKLSDIQFNPKSEEFIVITKGSLYNIKVHIVLLIP
jgi:hypothetical protein